MNKKKTRLNQSILNWLPNYLGAELLCLQLWRSSHDVVNSTKQSLSVCQHRKLIPKGWSTSIQAMHQHFVYSAQSQVNTLSIILFFFYELLIRRSVRHKKPILIYSTLARSYGCVLSLSYNGSRWILDISLD